jgi:hypothetical protein
MLEWPSCCPPKSKDDHLNHLNVLLRVYLRDGPDVPRVRHSENSSDYDGSIAASRRRIDGNMTDPSLLPYFSELDIERKY